MNKKYIIYIVGSIFILFMFFSFFILTNSQSPKKQIEKASKGKMRITSQAFTNNSYIPKKYSCDGENINPFLSINEIPENTKSLVLIVDDPDAPAGTWVHWVVFNIDPKIREIAESSIPQGANLGKNDFGKLEYGGPCSPSETHRYFFKTYALDNTLNLPQGATKVEVEKTMEGHILDQGTLIGLHRR